MALKADDGKRLVWTLRRNTWRHRRATADCTPEMMSRVFPVNFYARKQLLLLSFMGS